MEINHSVNEMRNGHCCSDEPITPIFDKFRVTNKTIRLNRSKSLLIRYLIADYLAQRRLPEVFENDSDDVKIVNHSLQMIADKHDSTERVVIDVKDCGAAYRFLLSVLAITPGNWFLTGTKLLLSRPIMPLIRVLTDIGADICQVENGIEIVGKPLKANKLAIDCSESSQFASSLLLIADKLGMPDIQFLNIKSSFSYVEMTKLVINNIRNNQMWREEGDWSSAAIWYAFLLLSDYRELLLSNLYRDSIQGDSIIASWFTSLGIVSEQVGNDVLIKKQEGGVSKTMMLDFSNNPDLAPIMAVTAVLKPFDLNMTGLYNLNKKESRRLENLEKTLSNFAPTQLSGSSQLIILGNQRYVKNEKYLFFNTHRDHRLAMAFSLFSLFYNVQLSDIECVSKSYPQFQKYYFLD